MQAIPTQITLAKLIPNNIEATMFGTLTGLLVFSNAIWSKILGNFWNLFFNVTNETIEDIWKLYLIAALSALVPLTLTWVAPSHDEIGRTQKAIKFADEFSTAEHSKDKDGDKKAKFEMLKSKSTKRLEKKKADAVKRAESTNDSISDIEDEDGFEFHKEVENLDPAIAEQLGIYKMVKEHYDLEFHPERNLAQPGLT